MPTAGQDDTTPPIISPADLDTAINHEPRIQDLRLANALGFADPHKIRALIERHKDALEAFGAIFRHVAENAGRRGRPGKGSYYLNKRQALFVTAKSDTERAAMVTIQMVEVFDAVSRGEATASLPPTLSDDERQLLETYRRLALGQKALIQAYLSVEGAKGFGSGGKEPPPPGATPLALPSPKGRGPRPELIHPLRALVVVFRHPPGNVTLAAAEAWIEAADRLEWTLDGCGIPPAPPIPLLRPLRSSLPPRHQAH